MQHITIVLCLGVKSSPTVLCKLKQRPCYTFCKERLDDLTHLLNAPSQNSVRSGFEVP